MFAFWSHTFPSNSQKDSEDVEKGTEVTRENVEGHRPSQYEHPFSEDELDLDDDEENENDPGIADADLVEAPTADTTDNKRPFHRRSSLSTGISLFLATSIDLPYRPRSGPPQWWVKLKAFLYPPEPQNDDDEHTPNYRYTPIFSAILIPFSILLEIPGLTGNWYIRTVDNQTVEKRPNPAILDVGLGFSMACALVANIALIVRFLERNVRLMTMICVVFLTLHDLINIIAVTTFGIEHRFDDGFTYGQSFWMTLCSTIASTITNASLVIDSVRTPDFANSGSGLTRKQRSLVIIVIMLLVYIAFGSLIESVLLDLNFIDALYFTVCSIETIGFGDVLPVTTGSKVFVCFYSIFGIINLALAVSLTREIVVEALEAGYRKRVRAARAKRKNLRWQKRVARRWREAVEWRLRERGQPTFVMDTAKQSGIVGFIRYWVLQIVDWTFPQWTWTSKWKGPGAVAHPKGMHLNLEALEGPALEGAAMEAGVPLNELLPPGFAKRWREHHPPPQTSQIPTPIPGSTPVPPPVSRNNSSNTMSQFNAWLSRLQKAQRDYDSTDVPLTHARLGRMVAMLGGFAFAVDRSGPLRGTVKGSSSPTSAKRPGFPAVAGAPQLGSLDSSRSDNRPFSKKVPKSLSQQYDAYRVAMEKEEAKAFYARLVVVWTFFIVFWMLGSGVFMATEGWSFGIALYFCVITFTSIGYGDYSPKTPAGRSIFVVWALLGVATMTILISVLAEAYTTRYKSAVQSTKIFDRAVTRYKAREKAKALTKSEKLPSSIPGIPPPPFTLLLSEDITRMSPRHSNHVPLPSHSFSDTHLHVKSGLGSTVSHTLRVTEKKLEELPRRILAHTRAFHEHLQFFVGPGSINSNGGSSREEQIPQSLKTLLDDIAGASKFGERIQMEILQDKEARQTLFTLSIEKALRKMIEAAEEAIESLEERDRLLGINGGPENGHGYGHGHERYSGNGQISNDHYPRRHDDTDKTPVLGRTERRFSTE
ncbi:hypothetical protein GYMLUDRAFT_48173 [Collybiopsis luxurians FD-317 M1]|uniref:Potassium channel domain-containing protein n=1 Tax=Collybiopsis luxurians FD-317 M1 TaxID=944289 RepID=A0A0D0BYQ1_9AGAR|nr:hypothetical protein GYMLUDRAFT_48173 [Collybiopsis luxurians FD-317 M1]